MRFGFSIVGAVFLAMLFIPNIKWAKHQPLGYEELSQHEDKTLLAFERVGQVLTTTSAVVFVCPRGFSFPWVLWLAAACVLMVLYEVAWVRYFRDGEKLDGISLIEKLNALGAANGIGICDMVENRLVGMKSRGVYETPAGTILYAAHSLLESITIDRDTAHYKELVAARFAELVYFGQWYCTLRESLSAFVDKTQENVTGTVKLKLYKGNCIPAGIKSDYSLYNPEFATFDEDEVYNQKDSEGFINLFGLPLTVNALMKENLKK